jgi:hypothetical protein
MVRLRLSSTVSASADEPAYALVALCLLRRTGRRINERLLGRFGGEGGGCTLRKQGRFSLNNHDRQLDGTKLVLQSERKSRLARPKVNRLPRPPI